MEVINEQGYPLCYVLLNLASCIKFISFCLNSLLFLLANNPDVVDKLEGLIAQWSKVIEQVLAESEQVGAYNFLSSKSSSASAAILEN